MDSLTEIQRRIIDQAMESLPRDDRQWVMGNRRQTKWEEHRNNPTYDYDYSRMRRVTDEPDLRDVHYHIFGLAGAGDLDCNRQLIKVLQESTGETHRNMLELANRTEQALQMMTGVTEHLVTMEEHLKQHHEWIVRHFNYMEIADDALQTFDLLMTMILEDRLGAVVYIHDLIDKSYAYRHGVQALLQGKLTIDLVPPTMIKADVAEVTDYLKRDHPRFSVAFKNAAFYYDNSSVYEKYFEASDILYTTSDILNIINYYFILFPRTSCPTFWHKTSDMEVKTSDMSGCPTTFHLHCNSKPLFIREDQHLVVFVRMPIVSEEHFFRVYEILTFPVPITEPGQSRKDALQVAGLPPQVALSLSQRYYIPMHSMSWAGCYEETILLCKDIPYMKKVSDRTRMAALRRDQQGVTRRCDLDYLLNPEFGEMAIYLDDGQVLVVSSETEGQLLCGSKPPVKTCIENYAKLAIGCDCAFQRVGAWFPYSLRACQTRVSNTYIQYPSSRLLKARMHVETWKKDITEGGRSPWK